jgi:hypothetical protein
MYMLSNLPEDVYLKLLNTEDAIADGNYPASTAYIDVKDFEKFGFLILAGALDTQMVFKVKQDTDATETAAIKDVSGATVTVPALGDDKWYAIEVETRKLDINNGFTFVTLNEAGAAGGNDYAAILFYGIPHVKPTTQPTGVAGEGATVIVAG